MTPTEIANELTAIYRTPNGTMTLRDVQGLILLGADEVGGAWTNASVGLGKSLACALLMTVIGGARPLVVTEASNIPQMRADFERFRLHWQMPTYYRLESYETISNRPELLDSLNPTFVALDEAHRIKPYKDSARARRMDRWRRAHPAVPMACLSGSPGEDFDQYAHTLVWAVPALGSDQGGPIPLDPETGRPEGPAFKDLCKRLREDAAVHEAFWTRVRATPGVVISDETYTEKPLHITHSILDTSDEMLPHWERLRGDGEAPDGWVLDTGIGEQYQLARMLANGMYYEHVPRPPKEFTEPRKAWFAMCKDVIEEGNPAHGDGGVLPCDTPGQVARAVLAGRLPRGPYDAWMRVKDTYRPVTKTTWLSHGALEWAAAWGAARAPLAERHRGGSIVWVDPIGVGEELAKMTGWPYFGAGAKAGRRHISTICRPAARGEKIDPVIICSSQSCATGKNLQHRYHRNLFMSPPSNCKAAEQRIGRTHRSEQYNATGVEVTMLYGCLEDWCAYAQAEARARIAEQDLTAPRKLLLAQHDRTSYPGEDAGPAWKRVSRVEVEI
ncbi:MAG: hypothetical protein V4593_08395 [Pseudomonadota bacterium]